MFKDTSEITQNKIHALRLISLQKKKAIFQENWLHIGSLKVFPEKNHTDMIQKKKQIKALAYSNKSENC